jgi:DNA-binding MarR family transcriptional regulator
MLDDNAPGLLDHIGWRLLQAARNWKSDFEQRMMNRGYSWFGEARASLLMHLSRGGTPQSVLAQRMGLSKQAVQQLVDQLVEDGLLERRQDPGDKRGKLLFFTNSGNQLLHAANGVKQEIETAYRAALGIERFAALQDALARLANPCGLPAAPTTEG